jgi:cytochrome c biogenesis protein
MSTTTQSQDKPLNGGSTSGKASGAGFIRFWSSVKLGIAMILAIAISSILGTLVPQGDPAGIMNSPMSDQAKQILLAVGAHNVYYSWWFLTLLAVFFFNLAMSTWFVCMPKLRVALKPPRPMSEGSQERQHADRLVLPAVEPEKVAQVLRDHRFRVFAFESGQIVADKGRVSRFSALVTHIGLFLLLIGGVVSGLTGFKSQAPLFVGQEAPINDIVKVAHQHGALASGHYDWSVRLDKFWMDYYTPTTVRQFYSTLTIQRPGKAPETHQIHVNKPLRVDGVTFYQAFWGLGGAKLAIGDSSRMIEMENAERFKLEGSISRRVDIGQGQYFLYLPDHRAPLQIVDLGTFQPVATLTPGQSTTLSGEKVSYLEPALYSGLQVKADPGIPIVYAGFFTVVLGVALAFISHRQVWLSRRPTGEYLLSGTANRGRFTFQQEMLKISSKLGTTA